MENHGGNIYRIEKELGIKKEEIYDFSSNINFSGISSRLKKGIKKNINSIQNYPDPDYYDLKEVLSEYNEIQHDRIVVGNGATELIYLYPKVLNPKKVLIIAPTFSEYYRGLHGYATQVNYFELKEAEGFRLNILDLINEIKNGYDLIILCNPNNPTSTFIDIGKIEKIVFEAAKYNSRIMIDESFIEFVADGINKSCICLINKYKNIFLLRSLTKFFAIPGLRLGYALCSDDTIISIIKERQEPWSVNVLADLAGTILLKDKDYIQKSIQLLARERDFLSKKLKGIEWLKIYEPSANFILLKILNKLTSMELKNILLKDKILIRDASNFTFLNSAFIRLAVKDRRSNEYIIKRLQEITLRVRSGFNS